MRVEFGGGVGGVGGVGAVRAHSLWVYLGPEQ